MKNMKPLEKIYFWVILAFMYLPLLHTFGHLLASVSSCVIMYGPLYCSDVTKVT